jgi:hypothetical protein
MLNDIGRAFSVAGSPVTKVSIGLSCSDGKCQGGITLIPWQNDKALCRDVTVICTTANSFMMRTALQSADRSNRKQEKYMPLFYSHIFEPLAFETNGAVNKSAQKLISNLRHRISSSSNDC